MSLEDFTDEDLIEELLKRDYGPFTIDCDECVTAWPHRKHRRTIWLYTGITIDEHEALHL